LVALATRTHFSSLRPRARVDAGDALPVGALSEAEYMAVDMVEEIDASGIAGAMRGRLPDGVEIVGAAQVPVGSPSVSESIARMTYEVPSEGLDERAAAAKALLTSDKPIPFTRVRKGREVEVDIRDYVDELAIEKGGVLRLTVLVRQPAMKVAEILQALIGISVDEARRLAVRKVSVEWK